MFNRKKSTTVATSAATGTVVTDGPHPAATAAANWWAEQIGAPKFDNLGPTRDAYGSRERELNDMAVLTALMGTKPVTAEASSRFAQILAGKVAAKLKRASDYGFTLAVDYGPDPDLAAAAEEAGAPGRNFPWKTCMWINRDHVTVSAGYQAPTRLVWASEEWLANRPACAQQPGACSRPYSDDYHGEPWSCSLPKYHDEAEHQYDTPLALCATCGNTEMHGHHDAERHSWAGDVHDFTPRTAA